MDSTKLKERVKAINNILDTTIFNLLSIPEPALNDSKQLTETLKSMLLLNQIENLQGSPSQFDDLSSVDLNSKIKDMFEE